jgi:hypothetical protein
MELEIDGLTVECDGRYTPQSQDTIHGGQWLPGDEAMVRDFRVYLTTLKKKIEITEFLPLDVLDQLEEQYLERITEE